MADGTYRRENMKTEKSIIIVSESASQESDVFYRSNLENHAIGCKEFSDLFKLGLTDESFGDKKGELFGPHWADGIAQKGNVVILIDFMIILYIPETITDFQYHWLIKQKPKMKQQEEMIRAIIYQKEDTEYISYGLENISKLDLIYQYIEEKHKNKSQSRR